MFGVLQTNNETFPNSWFLPPSGVERGGTSLEKGDPLTLGFPSKGITNQNNFQVSDVFALSFAFQLNPSCASTVLIECSQ